MRKKFGSNLQINVGDVGCIGCYQGFHLFLVDEILEICDVFLVKCDLDVRGLRGGGLKYFLVAAAVGYIIRLHFFLQKQVFVREMPLLRLPKHMAKHIVFCLNTWLWLNTCILSKHMAKHTWRQTCASSKASVGE